VPPMYYNCLPKLIDADFRMKRSRATLWKKVHQFYQEVRNPLFHGSELHTDGHKHIETLDSVLKALDLFVEIYNWVDWWCPPRFLELTGAIPSSEPPTVGRLKQYGVICTRLG